MKLIVRVGEAAEMLRTSPNKVQKLLEEGEIEAYRDGKNWSIPVSAVEEYVYTRAKEETERRRDICQRRWK